MKTEDQFEGIAVGKDPLERRAVETLADLVEVLEGVGHSLGDEPYAEILAGTEEHELVRKIFLDALEDANLTGSREWEEIEEGLTTGSPSIDLARVSIHYAAQAVREHREGSCEEAWGHMCEAQYYAGVLRGRTVTLVDEQNPAAAMAFKRHAQSRAEKRKVREYWRMNIPTSWSAQKAADDLIKTGLFTLSHPTLAEIVSEEKKIPRK